ncbi:DNA alkylation repair protein [Rufibacter sp. DG15C]|uniref:DNA alkylation repair protein n=1 Tax=Rufibacter sp. DG15C TaxID=1379909 RepID=UPI00078E76DE|nr:DNA alkylation repair protein [Rufibacter sp. DG15C]AMM50013.1 DNA alkylation repair protein [Rufibacter sp. DG15C]
MTVESVLEQLAALGSEQTKKTLLRHGGPENMYGVKVQDLKKVLKQTKQNHALALEVYATGNSDAMYLAGLMADPKQMSPTDLQVWAEQANWSMLSEYTVPWVAAESGHGLEMGVSWIDSDQALIASAGWSTLGSYVALQPDDQLNLALLEQLLERVKTSIHASPNRVRYTMNNFVIAVGCYVVPLHEKAQEVAQAIGEVHVSMGDTACKVPEAVGYIQKVAGMGKIGQKRKTVRC